DLSKTGEDDKAMKKFFAPEFRNRLDAVIKFKKLGSETVSHIVKKFIGELNTQLKDKGIRINATNDAIDWLAVKGYDSKMGARPLARVIDKELKSPLSRRVLFGDLVNGGEVIVNVKDDALTFTVVPKKNKKEAEALPAPITEDENQDNQS
ncbi:MAG: hypothetical protein ABFD07_17685, partial [Methanobacterium sp.]